MMDTTDEWIQTRSGIKERRVLPEPKFDLALPACSQLKMHYQMILMQLLLGQLA